MLLCRRFAEGMACCCCSICCWQYPLRELLCYTFQGLNRSESVKLMFGTAAALFDAGIAAWVQKRFYDSTRPLQMIQCLYADQMVRTFALLSRGVSREVLFNNGMPEAAFNAHLGECLAGALHGSGHDQWVHLAPISGDKQACMTRYSCCF